VHLEDAQLTRKTASDVEEVDLLAGAVEPALELLELGPLDVSVEALEDNLQESVVALRPAARRGRRALLSGYPADGLFESTSLTSRLEYLHPQPSGR
jgi:hypothetical protein